jgi:tight adherence protein B
VSRGAVFAGLAGACAILGAWEALVALERARATSAIIRVLAPLRRARREGRAPTAPERRRLALLAAATLLACGWILFGPIVGAALAAAGPPALLAVARARRRRYLAELRRGAPLAARALSDALAGGHAIRAAIGQAARGLPGAAGAELRATAAALALGEPTERALERLRRRAASPAWDTIVAAILLTREAGGDLASLLRGCAHALEEATRLEAEARSATAQARFTGLLVMALPAGAAGLAELASPGYIGSLARAPLTAWLVGCAVGLQLMGLVAIRRMAKVVR